MIKQTTKQIIVKSGSKRDKCFTYRLLYIFYDMKDEKTCQYCEEYGI